MEDQGQDPLPLSHSEERWCRKGEGSRSEKGGPGSKGGRGPGSRCSSACEGSRNVGAPSYSKLLPF